MSKAVLISIRPKWCELIASGKKTIEIRKTFPKIIPPFNCYIYCTKDPGNKGSATHFYESDDGSFCSAGKTYAAFLSGTIIGEFICDGIARFDIPFPAYMDQVDTRLLKAACLSYSEAHAFLGHRSGYGWHISDLMIYDEPKKLSEFQLYYTSAVIEDGLPMLTNKIRRPPQSWCYVKEIDR